jgi:hypothetical protein
MGAAKDQFTCGQVIFNQVAAVGKLALTAVTLGSSMSGGAGASAITNAGALGKLKSAYEELKTKYDLARQAYPAIQTAEKAYEVGSNLNKLKNDIQSLSNAAVTIQNQAALTEDIIRASAQMAAIVDSSGVSSTVAAYSYPKCSRYFPPGGGSTGSIEYLDPDMDHNAVASGGTEIQIHETAPLAIDSANAADDSSKKDPSTK